jgi:hypothetical protein
MYQYGGTASIHKTRLLGPSGSARQEDIALNWPSGNKNGSRGDGSTRPRGGMWYWVQRASLVQPRSVRYHLRSDLVAPRAVCGDGRRGTDTSCLFGEMKVSTVLTWACANGSRESFCTRGWVSRSRACSTWPPSARCASSRSHPTAKVRFVSTVSPGEEPSSSLT